MQTLPVPLRKTALTPVVRLFDNEAFNRFKLQKLFRGGRDTDTVYSEQEFEYEIELVLRNIGEWHADPQPADRESDVQAGLRRAQVLFWAESFFLNSNDLALFKDFGESKDLPLTIQDLLAKRDRVLARNTRRKVTKARRAVEKFCADVLSTQPSNVTVDGVVANLNYGVGFDTAAVTWATSTTDIIQEFAEWITNFIDQSGAPPTHIVTSHHFWPTYITGNDDFREFSTRNLASMSDTERLLRAAGRADLLGIEWINITDRYLLAGTPTQIWPTERMTFLNMDDSDGPVLELATTRTFDNDLNGGLFAQSKMHDEHPMRLEVTVSNNNIPLVRNHQNVTIHNLVP